MAKAELASGELSTATMANVQKYCSPEDIEDLFAIACHHVRLPSARLLRVTDTSDSGKAYSLLHWAVLQEREEVLSFLLDECRFDLEARCRGETVLHVACGAGYLGSAHLLLARGADQEARVCGGSPVSERVGWTPLHLACHHGWLAVVMLLQSHGASAGVSDAMGRQPCDIACEQGHVCMLRQMHSIEPFPPTPLQRMLLLACRSGHGDAVRFLQSCGVDLDCRTRHTLRSPNGVVLEQVTALRPLHIACEYGHLLVVRLLQGFNVNMAVRDGLGRGAMHYACMHGHVELVCFLFDFGLALSTPTSREGLSPVAMACKHDKPEVRPTLPVCV